jgi:hypothetical protein
MRNFIAIGTVGLLLTLGATAANAQSLLTRPSASPYALLNQQTQPGNAFAPIVEGRSAFTDQSAPNAAPVVERHWSGRSLQ